MEAIGLMTLPRMNRRRITGVDDGSKLLAGGELWRFLLQRSAFGRPIPVPVKAKKIGSEQGGAGGSGCRRLRRNAGCRVTDRRKKDGLKRSRMKVGSTSECCRNRQEYMRRVIRRAKVSSSCSVGNSDSVDSDNSGCVDWRAPSIMKSRGRGLVGSMSGERAA